MWIKNFPWTVFKGNTLLKFQIFAMEGDDFDLFESIPSLYWFGKFAFRLSCCYGTSMVLSILLWFVNCEELLWKGSDQVKKENEMIKGIEIVSSEYMYVNITCLYLHIPNF